MTNSIQDTVCLELGMYSRTASSYEDLICQNPFQTQQLIALKGIKKGTLKKAREKSFMEGREYKHVAHDGMPWDNSPCFYNLEEIDRWIERQASARPRRHLT